MTKLDADKEYDKPMDQRTFSEAVLLSQKVGRYRGQSTIEVIMGLCEDYKIEEEDLPKLLDDRVKRRLEEEGKQTGAVKGKVNKNKLF